MEMACSAPLAISYSAAFPSTSSTSSRHRVRAVGSLGGCSWRNGNRLSKGQVQGAVWGANETFVCKLHVISSDRVEATVVKATESATEVADAAVGHKTDPTKMFWFDLREYESTNGPVCLKSFVPNYDASHLIETPAVKPETAAGPYIPPTPQSPFARYPDLKPPSSPTPRPPVKIPAAKQEAVVAEPSATADAEPPAVPPVAAEPTPPEPQVVASLPWSPLKPQSPYTRFPELKPPASPTPRPPLL